MDVTIGHIDMSHVITSPAAWIHIDHESDDVTRRYTHDICQPNWLMRSSKGDWYNNEAASLACLLMGRNFDVVFSSLSIQRSSCCDAVVDV